MADPTLAEDEVPDLESLKLEDVTFKLQPNQKFWSVGNGCFNDIDLSKTRSVFTTQFIITYHSGHFYAKDMNKISSRYDLLIKFPSKVEAPVKVGQAVNIGTSQIYGIKQLEGELVLEWLNDAIEGDNQSQEEKKAAYVNGVVNVGKPKQSNEIEINSNYFSRKHCHFTSTHITDKSSLGTYLLLRNSEEEQKGFQSHLVKLNKDVVLALNGYKFVLE